MGWREGDSYQGDCWEALTVILVRNREGWTGTPGSRGVICTKRHSKVRNQRMGNRSPANMNQKKGGMVIVLSDKIEFLWAPYKTLSRFAIFRCSCNSLPGRHCQWALCLPHLQGKWPNLTPGAGGEATVPAGAVALLQPRPCLPLSVL